jgi:hypothetical protein
MPAPRRRLAALAVLAGIASVVPAPAAHADVIDGDWCAAGKHLSIKGPEIVTPAGTKLRGDYSRHFFSYIVPSTEPGAGQIVAMTLVNENTVHRRGCGGGCASPRASLAPLRARCKLSRPASSGG